MGKLRCEVCDSADIMKMPQGYFECQTCGCRYSLEQLRSLFAGQRQQEQEQTQAPATPQPPTQPLPPQPETYTPPKPASYTQQAHTPRFSHTAPVSPRPVSTPVTATSAQPRSAQHAASPYSYNKYSYNTGSFVLYPYESSSTTDLNLKYELSGDVAIISGYRHNPTHLVIPATIEGKPVIAIRVNAFFCCKSLRAVAISENVTSIGVSSFASCTELHTVSIPPTMLTIGKHAFANCPNLRSIYIPKSVTSIGTRAFFNCSSLTDLYYGGSERNWLQVCQCLSDLYSTTIHYESALDQPTKYL